MAMPLLPYDGHAVVLVPDRRRAHRQLLWGQARSRCPRLLGGDRWPLAGDLAAELVPRLRPPSCPSRRSLPGLSPRPSPSLPSPPGSPAPGAMRKPGSNGGPRPRRCHHSLTDTPHIYLPPAGELEKARSPTSTASTNRSSGRPGSPPAPCVTLLCQGLNRTASPSSGSTRPCRQRLLHRPARPRSETPPRPTSSACSPSTSSTGARPSFAAPSTPPPSWDSGTPGTNATTSRCGATPNSQEPALPRAAGTPQEQHPAQPCWGLSGAPSTGVIDPERGSGIRASVDERLATLCS